MCSPCDMSLHCRGVSCAPHVACHYIAGGCHVLPMWHVITLQGVSWATHGHTSDGKLYLTPYEAVFLMESVSTVES